MTTELRIADDEADSVEVRCVADVLVIAPRM